MPIILPATKGENGMRLELYVLVLGCVLGIVHIFWAGQAKTKQYGTKWNAGPRDAELPPPEPLVGRLMRAQGNYFETFPIVAALILVLAAAGISSVLTELGALIWFGARIVYVPLYAMGVPVVRSMVFLVSLAGILMLLWAGLSVGITQTALF
jgi:uncharacterized MAPEG superfamily protein